MTKNKLNTFTTYSAVNTIQYNYTTQPHSKNKIVTKKNGTRHTLLYTANLYGAYLLAAITWGSQWWHAQVSCHCDKPGIGLVFHMDFIFVN